MKVIHKLSRGQRFDSKSKAFILLNFPCRIWSNRVTTVLTYVHWSLAGVVICHWVLTNLSLSHFISVPWPWIRCCIEQICLAAWCRGISVTTFLSLLLSLHIAGAASSWFRDSNYRLSASSSHHSFGKLLFMVLTKALCEILSIVFLCQSFTYFHVLVTIYWFMLISFVQFIMLITISSFLFSYILAHKGAFR